MVDNFGKIKSFLETESDDDFFFLQVLKRKKENPDIGSNSYCLKTYYVSSREYLEKKRKEIIDLCDSNNARAYINLNRRSYEKMAFHVLKKLSDQIMNKDYKSVKKSYDSVCGSFSNEKNKKWIIDIDSKDTEFIESVKSYVEDIQGDFYDLIPTKNGFHIITSPFNLSFFREKYNDVDVHKDNPTILYIP